MKKQFSSFAISALILSATALPVSNEAPATSETVKVEKADVAGIAFFRTHRQGKGVTATWGLTSNAGVTGFSLQRTYEDPNDPYSIWDEIANAPCGTARSYRVTDKNVSPGLINYKVVVSMEDGSTFESVVSTVQVVAH